ncbi:hypothetical protein SCFA_90042 [anaerobic digester metagenome]|uniref:Uncharacterized protein n=1 Tax=anaerobic digester metagenome TaxID=1263854 RepID=A0A485MCS9_9ZZZZ
MNIDFTCSNKFSYRNYSFGIDESIFALKKLDFKPYYSRDKYS